MIGHALSRAALLRMSKTHPANMARIMKTLAAEFRERLGGANRSIVALP